MGITNTGVQDENDPAYALLCESVTHADPNVAIGAIMGLGLAYALVSTAFTVVWAVVPGGTRFLCRLRF